MSQRGRPEARGGRRWGLAGRLAAGLGRLVVAVGVGRLALAVVGCGATLGRLGLRVARGPAPLRAGPKGKGGAPAPAQGKGRGKGKGNARHGATDPAAAKRELAQFLQLHGDFTFAPPAEILTVYDELYEGSLGLYKHMARHMRTPAALAILHKEILPEMARESHWRVDKQNHVEKKRRDSRELGASRSSRSSVSRASGWTSRTFGA